MHPNSMAMILAIDEERDAHRDIGQGIAEASYAVAGYHEEQIGALKKKFQRALDIARQDVAASGATEHKEEPL